MNDLKQKIEELLHQSETIRNEETQYSSMGFGSMGVSGPQYDEWLNDILIMSMQLPDNHVMKEVIQDLYKRKNNPSTFKKMCGVLKSLNKDESIMNSNDKEKYELMLQILKSFSNSIKRITSDRYNKREGIHIEDEYDVQDILFCLLKGVYKDLRREDPLPKQAGISSRIDLDIPSEGIMIEVKMIKSTDKDTNKYIKQLKEDITNYSSVDWLKYLVLFIYDPGNKTKDDNDFYELNQVLKNDRRFEIEVILAK